MCTRTRIPHSFANFWIWYVSRIPVNFSRTRILGVLGTGTGTGTSTRRFPRRVTRSTRRKTGSVQTLFYGEFQNLISIGLMGLMSLDSEISGTQQIQQFQNFSISI